MFDKQIYFKFAIKIKLDYLNFVFDKNFTTFRDGYKLNPITLVFYNLCFCLWFYNKKFKLAFVIFDYFSKLIIT